MELSSSFQRARSAQARGGSFGEAKTSGARAFKASAAAPVLRRAPAAGGIVLLSAVVLVAIFVSAVLGISFITIRQVHIARDIRQSAVAIVAADAGAEAGLFEYWRNSEEVDCAAVPDGSLFGGVATYEISCDFAQPAGSRVVESIGRYRGEVQRAFRLEF